MFMQINVILILKWLNLHCSKDLHLKSEESCLVLELNGDIICPLASRHKSHAFYVSDMFHSSSCHCFPFVVPLFLNSSPALGGGCVCAHRVTGLRVCHWSHSTLLCPRKSLKDVAVWSCDFALESVHTSGMRRSVYVYHHLLMGRHQTQWDNKEIFDT